MSYPHSTFYAKTPEETEVLSKDLASAVAAQSPIEAVIYLDGDLGAGKTTFSRYFIREPRCLGCHDDHSPLLQPFCRSVCSRHHHRFTFADMAPPHG